MSARQEQTGAPQPEYYPVPVEQQTDPPVQPPVVVRRPRWVLPVLVALSALTVAAVSFGFWTRTGWRPFNGNPSSSADPPLLTAYDACGKWGELSDGNTTLYLDLAGNDAGSGTLTYADLQCYYVALHIPDYVTKHMESTRALDGRQSDTWDRYEASWTYHPDDGLDVLIHQLH